MFNSKYNLKSNSNVCKVGPDQRLVYVCVKNNCVLCVYLIIGMSVCVCVCNRNKKEESN